MIPEPGQRFIVGFKYLTYTYEAEIIHKEDDTCEIQRFDDVTRQFMTVDKKWFEERVITIKQ